MPRYIDTEDFKHLINASSLYGTDEWVKVLNLLADAPTADVRENVHGEWIKRKVLEPLAWDASPFDYDEYEEETHSEWVEKIFCSNCGCETSIGKAKFCPNCGADMGERRNNGEIH